MSRYMMCVFFINVFILIEFTINVVKYSFCSLYGRHTNMMQNNKKIYNFSSEDFFITHDIMTTESLMKKNISCIKDI